MALMTPFPSLSLSSLWMLTSILKSFDDSACSRKGYSSPSSVEGFTHIPSLVGHSSRVANVQRSSRESSTLARAVICLQTRFLVSVVDFFPLRRFISSLVLPF